MNENIPQAMTSQQIIEQAARQASEAADRVVNLKRWICREGQFTIDQEGAARILDEFFDFDTALEIRAHLGIEGREMNQESIDAAVVVLRKAHKKFKQLSSTLSDLSFYL